MRLVELGAHRNLELMIKVDRKEVSSGITPQRINFIQFITALKMLGEARCDQIILLYQRLCRNLKLNTSVMLLILTSAFQELRGQALKIFKGCSDGL